MNIKNHLIQLKETLFLYLFFYEYFDLNMMKNINIIFDRFILNLSECSEE